MTASEAASRAGMSPAVFRATMARARRAGVDARLPGPDARTPLWDVDAVTAYLAGRSRGGTTKRPRPCREAGAGAESCGGSAYGSVAMTCTAPVLKMTQS